MRGTSMFTLVAVVLPLFGGCATMPIGRDLAAIKTTKTQTAGGNINDPWAIRFAVIGGPLSMLAYIFVLRPLRRRRNCRREKVAGETAGEFGLPITGQIRFAVDRQTGGGQAPLRADQP